MVRMTQKIKSDFLRKVSHHWRESVWTVELDRNLQFRSIKQIINESEFISTRVVPNENVVGTDDYQ